MSLEIDLDVLETTARACGDTWYVSQDIGNVLDLVEGADNLFVVAASPAVVLELIRQLQETNTQLDQLVISCHELIDYDGDRAAAYLLDALEKIGLPLPKDAPTQPTVVDGKCRFCDNKICNGTGRIGNIECDGIPF